MKKKNCIVVGVSSLPGGGKDYIAEILVNKYGFYKVSPGDTVREIIKKFGSEMTFEMEQQIQAQLRKKYGDDYIMELCYKKILESKQERIVIPGIRRPRDVAFYKNKFGDSFLNIFVYAPRHIRYERVRERGREDEHGVLSYTEFCRRDKQQRDTYNLDKTRKVSDIFLRNSENESKKLKLKLDVILERLGL